MGSQRRQRPGCSAVRGAADGADHGDAILAPAAAPAGSIGSLRLPIKHTLQQMPGWTLTADVNSLKVSGWAKRAAAAAAGAGAATAASTQARSSTFGRVRCSRVMAGWLVRWGDAAEVWRRAEGLSRSRVVAMRATAVPAESSLPSFRDSICWSRILRGAAMGSRQAPRSLSREYAVRERLAQPPRLSGTYFEASL